MNEENLKENNAITGAKGNEVQQVEAVAAETRGESTGADTPLAGKSPVRKAVGKARLWAVCAIAVFVVGAMFLGGGKSPAKKCLGQLRDFVDNAEAGRIDRVFGQLPPSWQSDLREMAQGIAGAAGEKFFSEFAGASVEAASFIRKNRKELYGVISRDASGVPDAQWTEKDLATLADLLDALASKATHSYLSKGQVEPMLELGPLHQTIERWQPVWRKKWADIEFGDMEVEDRDEKEMPVVLASYSCLGMKLNEDGWPAYDPETRHPIFMRMDKTKAIGFTELDGIWVPVWAVDADNREQRRSAERNRQEWLDRYWTVHSAEIKRVIALVGPGCRDEIDELTSCLAQLRRDLKKLNGQKRKKGTDFEAVLKSLNPDIVDLERAVDKLESAIRRTRRGRNSRGW